MSFCDYTFPTFGPSHLLKLNKTLLGSIKYLYFSRWEEKSEGKLKLAIRESEKPFLVTGWSSVPPPPAEPLCRRSPDTLPFLLLHLSSESSGHLLATPVFLPIWILITAGSSSGPVLVTPCSLVLGRSCSDSGSAQGPVRWLIFRWLGTPLVTMGAAHCSCCLGQE